MDEGYPIGLHGEVDYPWQATRWPMTAAATTARVDAYTDNLPIPQDENDIQQDEIEALRARVAQLERELAETRVAARADEASRLGRTLLAYVFDVLYTLLLPRRGQTILAGMADSRARLEMSEIQSGAGPLQMALERPSFTRALQGHAASVKTRFECALWLPVLYGSRAKVILCLRRGPEHPFSEYEERIGHAVGPLVISALQTGRVHFDPREDGEMLLTLSSTLDSRIRVGGGRVAAMARDAERLAQELMPDEQQRRAVRLGAALHNIGTVNLAEEMLQREGPLNSQELSRMREHPALGAEIVRQLPGTEMVVPLVRHHHERWDGRGYPDGLTADAIPLGARIIAVVDAFHAMTSPRPYNAMRSVEDALQELRRCSNGQFDSRVVDQFVRLVRDEH